jgi:hypothetical protein
MKLPTIFGKLVNKEGWGALSHKVPFTNWLTKREGAIVTQGTFQAQSINAKLRSPNSKNAPRSINPATPPHSFPLSSPEV